MTATLVAGLGLLQQLAPAGAPAGSDIAWRNVGPGGGGWIQSIAADPHRPNVLHVGCDVGGYYRSDDGGQTYRIQNDGLRDYFIECIAVHATDPGTILLGAEGGVYKSTDDGRSWRWVRDGFPEPQRYGFSAPIGALAFDPSDPSTVYAGIGRPRWGKDGAGQIYRSTDTGDSWQLCTPEGMLPDDAIVSDIEVAPGTILAATTHGIFRSTDRGETWPKVEGLPHDSVQELAIAPASPSVVYATLRTTARDDEPWDGGVIRSEDGGLTWELRSEGLPTRVGKRSEPAPMTSNYCEVVVDPTDADVAYVGGTAWVTPGVYKTVDGGATWSPAAYKRQDGSSYTDYGWITQWGASVMCMTISPLDPERLYFGTSGQVYTTGDAGETWEQRYCTMLPEGRFAGTGLEVTCIMDIVFDPHRPERIYLGYNDIGLLVTDDGGQTFRRTVEGMAHSGNCFTVLPDPGDPDLLFACTGQWASNQGDVCRSRDGGRTWEVVGTPETGLPVGQTRTLRLDPESRDLYVSSKGNGLFRSTDAGDSWTDISGDLPGDARGNIRGFVMDPVDAGHIRVALGGSPAEGAGIYETTDGGRAWRKLNAGTEFADIQDLDADPGDFDTLYVCQRSLYDRAVDPPVTRPGGLFRSTDGGVTWTQLVDYHFAHRLTVSPLDPRVLYLGTTDHPYHDDSIAAGLLKSEDGGETWQTENAGLTSLQVSCIALKPEADGSATVAIGTGGNGVFIGVDASPLP